MSRVLPGLFVTGTDTGVGKTRVASAVARTLVAEGRRVGVLKPVATGASLFDGVWHCDDADKLIQGAGRLVSINRVTPILYEEAVAPSIAGRRRGEPLTSERLAKEVAGAIDWWAQEGEAEVLVVEGVGGLLCPLAEGTTVADLAVQLDYPVLVVARLGLGTLNHTLLTVEAALRRSLRLTGVVLNSATPPAGTLAEQTNRDELSRLLPDGVAILATIAYGDDSVLPDDWHHVDWFGRALVPRLSGSG